MSNPLGKIYWPDKPDQQPSESQQTKNEDKTVKYIPCFEHFSHCGKGTFKNFNFTKCERRVKSPVLLI